MDNKQQKQDSDKEAFDKEVERTLQEAKIIARWAKKPFYIS